MKITRIHLENFRGLTELDLEPDGKNAIIYGANGTGKTTVANAIIWTLLDMPATGEKDFAPKTIGAHDLHHVAELTVQADDGSLQTLRKDFFEVWTRKKGAQNKEFSGHKTEYNINGIPHKKGAYNKAVERICGTSLENVKKMMVSGHFLDDLSVDERRQTLFDICGDVSDDEVMQAEGLEDLPAFLAIPGTDGQTYDTAEYLKMAKAQRTQLNKELTLIPARIDEVDKSIRTGPPVPAEEVETYRAKLVNQHKAVALELNTMMSQSGKAQAIAAAKAAFSDAARAYDEKIHEQNAGTYQKLGAMAAKRRELSGREEDLLNQIKSLEKEHDRLYDMRNDLLKAYADIDARQWDTGLEVCPTCHRELPPEQIAQLRDEFNQKKSREKEAINEKGQQCSKTKLADLEQKILPLSESHKAVKAELAQLMEDSNRLNQSLYKFPRFEDTDEAKALQVKINDAESTEDVTATEAYQNLSRQAAELTDKIRRADVTLAAIRANDNGRERLRELRQQQTDTAASLEHVEYGIHLVEEFSRKKAAMVTDKINARFKSVRFVLFEDQINGGLKEICEPTIQNDAGQWVPYKAANTAARVNAELEIIDVLNQYYHTSLPVIIDRAESISRPIDIPQQVIRLIVSPSASTLQLMKED